MKPFRLILPFLFLSSLLGGEELFWWFKVQGANPWLKSAIPYILFRDCPQKERFLLGYNFPGAEESVKLSERGPRRSRPTWTWPRSRRVSCKWNLPT